MSLVLNCQYFLMLTVLSPLVCSLSAVTLWVEWQEGKVVLPVQ